mmetsp:Transcript_22481/g.27979  ORF Transcript_22481/g.27979 Transcript_22481/m.27979 type:complete len:122 (+) Transcript_22481:373-738(+)
MFLNSFPCRSPLFTTQNLPLLGMTWYMLGTWLISTGNGLEYFTLQGTIFAPPYHSNVSRYQHKLILPFQLAGSLMLLVGSVIYLLFGFLYEWELVKKHDKSLCIQGAQEDPTTSSLCDNLI